MRLTPLAQSPGPVRWTTCSGSVFPAAIALTGEGRLDFGVDGTALVQAGALAMRLTPRVWGMVGAIFQRKGRKGSQGTQG